MQKPASPIRFWYDVKSVSGSHAEVTVGVAGLSLALLLMLPWFTNNNSTEYFSRPKIAISILLFFASLTFGILASFIYSVLSGDARSEEIRAIGFLSPSVAFGISVPILFLGFTYVIDAHINSISQMEITFITKIMRGFALFSLWASSIFVSRTILDVRRFVKMGDKWKDSVWFKGKMMILFILLYTTMSILSIIDIWKPAGAINTCVKAYFYYLIVVIIITALYYAVVSYIGIRKEGCNKVEYIQQPKENCSGWTPNLVSKLCYMLLCCFTVFSIWTFICFT